MLRWLARRERSAVEPAVRLIPLGGLGEIGLNMMLVEFGDDLIAIDCGLMFPDDELPGIDYVIPDFSYIRARRDAFRGVVLTHGHEDHVGAIPYLLRELPAPVYGTALALATGRIILATFASHIHRIQQVLTLAARFDRRVALLGRSMERNVAVAADLGYLTVPAGLIRPLEDVVGLPPARQLILSTGSQ